MASRLLTLVFLFHTRYSTVPMRMLFLLCVLLAACNDPCAPAPDEARLESGLWYVTLADGSICIARPFEIPHRDESEEAINECRGI